MHGSPLLRVLILAVTLVIAGFLISVVAGAKRPSGHPSIGTASPPPAALGETRAILSIQLSAPARRLTLTTLAGDPLVDLAPPEQEIELSVLLPIRDDTLTALLSVEWESPGPTRFLRLVLEPEERASREVLLHAPSHLDQHAIEFDWPPERSD